jgi:hypothetical protein
MAQDLIAHRARFDVEGQIKTEFRVAVEKLSNFRRTTAWYCFNTLVDRIRLLEAERERLEQALADRQGDF